MCTTDNCDTCDFQVYHDVREDSDIGHGSGGSFM